PEAAITELSRSITRSGAVMRQMRDGSRQLLLPTGTMAQLAIDSNCWRLLDKEGNTYHEGSQGWEMAPEGMKCQYQVDPATMSKLWCRSDGAVFVAYPDGITIAHHPDGTKQRLNPGTQQVLIEA
ncbi:unnamed protein product, partial [Chrysoparadoxa australica]